MGFLRPFGSECIFFIFPWNVEFGSSSRQLLGDPSLRSGVSWHAVAVGIRVQLSVQQPQVGGVSLVQAVLNEKEKLATEARVSGRPKGRIGAKFWDSLKIQYKINAIDMKLPQGFQGCVGCQL